MSFRTPRSGVIVAAFLVAVAGVPLPPGTGDPVKPANPRLEAALDVIKADNLRADLEFIAGDEMEGRDTPSKGLRTVARYIRARLMRLGLQPGAGNDYLYRYPLEYRKPDFKGTVASMQRGSQTVPLELGKDYFFRSSEAVTASYTGTLKYAEIGRKESFNGDFKGKWALVESDMRMFNERAENAREAQALGLIVIPSTSVPFEQYDMFFTNFGSMMSKGGVRWPAAEASIPAAPASAPAAESSAPTAEASAPAAQAGAPAAESSVPAAQAGAPTAEAGAPAAQGGNQAADSASSTPEEPKAAPPAPAPVFPSVYLSSASFIALCKLLCIDDPLSFKPAPGQEIDLTFTDDRKSESNNGLIDLENVCGFWPGSDEKLMKEVILVSAHYDHVGISRGEVHNGADDNGSGTTGLLGLAEALAAHGPMRRSVMLIWVSGEEKGLYGSRAWVEKPSLPEGFKPFVDINIDMIGRNDPNQLLITPTSQHPKYNGLSRIAETVSPLEGFPTLGSADNFWERSDQYNFAKLGIPVMFLFSDLHKDYHQPTDDVDKIDYDKMRRVTRLVMRIIGALQEDSVAVQ